MQKLNSLKKHVNNATDKIKRTIYSKKITHKNCIQKFKLIVTAAVRERKASCTKSAMEQ